MSKKYLRKKKVNSCKTHNKVGKNVRKFMLDNGGVGAEDLSTPEKSLKELKKTINFLI